MIIKCPKCKTEFEIDIMSIPQTGIKFQCAECSYIWTDGERQISPLPSDEKMEKNKLLYGLGVNDHPIEKKSKKFNISVKIISIFSIAMILFFGLFFILTSISNHQKLNGNKNSIFTKSSTPEQKQELYIEIAKPLTLVREGTNDYIIIRGFIYNPTNVILPIPELVIRLENKDGRILQEQERTVETKTLAPLEKTDFMFKVFRFSNQVGRIKVDFIQDDKI